MVLHSLLNVVKTVRGFLGRDLQTTVLEPIRKLVKVRVNPMASGFYDRPKVKYLAVISIGDYSDVSWWCWLRGSM